GFAYSCARCGIHLRRTNPVPEGAPVYCIRCASCLGPDVPMPYVEDVDPALLGPARRPRREKPPAPPVPVNLSEQPPVRASAPRPDAPPAAAPAAPAAAGPVAGDYREDRAWQQLQEQQRKKALLWSAGAVGGGFILFLLIVLIASSGGGDKKKGRGG